MTICDHLDFFADLPVADFTVEIDGDDDDDEDESEDDEEGSASAGTPGFRYFEYEDEKSSKFWEIKLNSSSFTVRYGKIGTSGQTQTKDFPTEEKAQKEYDKLLKEKTGKGYEEIAGGDSDFDPTKTVYRITVDYDESNGEAWLNKFNAYLKQPGVEKTVGLVVGAWDNMCEGDSSDPVVETLVNASSRLPNLTALFFGDVTGDECEISWINQTDISPLFNAFPNLTHLAVRGGTGLSIGTINHSKLEKLVIESGGLPRNVIQELIKSHLPNLEHLELWLGSDNYGGDVAIDDLKPLLHENLFPKLKYLGLRNSELSDAIAGALNGAPVMNLIETLDLSMGSLSDEGGQALLDNPAIERLKNLDLHHHYLSIEMVSQFMALPIEVNVTERETCDDDDESSRYIAVAE